jgi:hypothetical protein
LIVTVLVVATYFVFEDKLPKDTYSVEMRDFKEVPKDAHPGFLCTFRT